jgi:SAM-dependent methyltransferase
VYPSTLHDSSLTSDDFRCTSIAYGEHGDIGRCLECGLVYIVDPSTDASISAAYADVEDPEYVVGHEARIATFDRQLDRLERFTTSRGDLLEVGAYTGVFLSLARARGWNVTGIEPSRWACERAAQDHGIEVRNGPFRPGAYDPESMDAVVMWDVIEHLPDPLGATREAYRILRPCGSIALSTMDIGSFAARVSRGRWPWLMSMHLEYFSRATMRRMLEASGFTDIRFVTHVRSIRLRYLGDRMATRIPVVGAMVRAIGGLPGFSRVVVPFTIGDLFEVYARKPLAESGAGAGLDS